MTLFAKRCRPLVAESVELSRSFQVSHKKQKKPNQNITMRSSEQVKNVLSLRPPKNEPTLTGAEVEAYASQEFVQRALSTPSKVKSVLTFFFVSFSENHDLECSVGT